MFLNHQINPRAVNSAGEIEGESTAGEGPLAMRSGFQAVAFMLIIRCHQQLMHSRSRREHWVTIVNNMETTINPYFIIEDDIDIYNLVHTKKKILWFCIHVDITTLNFTNDLWFIDNFLYPQCINIHFKPRSHQIFSK